MGDIDDLFGPTPLPRPQHDDFTAMVKIVLQHDGKTEDAGYDMDADLASIIDAETVSYIALQRGFRMCREMGINPITQPGAATKLAALWIDAWMLATAWAGHKAEAARAKQVISCVFTEEDVKGIAADNDVDLDVALERAWEWGKHIRDTITGIGNEQLESVILTNNP